MAQHRIPLPPIGKTVKTVSRMGSKGSRFTLGSWVCSLDFAFASATVRKRSQPFATVRVRALWPQLLMSSAKMFNFGHFKRCVASFRVASVALCDIPTCLIRCPKSFCLAGTILLLSFQKMASIFRGRRNTLETSIVISPGRHSTLDVRNATLRGRRGLVCTVRGVKCRV